MFLKYVMSQIQICMFEIAISLVIDLNAIFKNACNLHHINVGYVFSYPDFVYNTCHILLNTLVFLNYIFIYH